MVDLSAPIIIPDEDFFASMDAAISKVTAKSKLLDRKKKLQTDLNPARHMTTTTRDALKRELHEVSAELERIQWLAIGSIALFTSQHCDNCGSNHSMFLQHMQEQVTSSGPRVTRYARVGRPASDLPRRVVIQPTVTHVCADCCGEFGFDLAMAEIKFAEFSEPFAVSKTAVQEEIEDHG